jgi:hypothetical protein
MNTPTVTGSSKYRSRSNVTSLIGLAISFEPKPLLARGFGLEHLRELLVRLARPILRSGADLAYAGDWKEREDNFTYDLLRLISAEQEDNSLGGPDTDLMIGRLRNHLAWPYYVGVTPRTEAQWIQCCRIIRVTQEMAGIDAAAIAPDNEPPETERFLLHSAITVSQLRRLAVTGMSVPIPGTPEHYYVSPLTARILLGGKTSQFRGFLPGIFEEALVTMEQGRPTYILGGFGGAAEILAKSLLGEQPQELEVAWQEAATPNLKTLRKLTEAQPTPAGVRSTAANLAALQQRLEQARPALAVGLQTGLAEADTRELLSTHDMGRAVQLVLKGLTQSAGLVLKRT